MTKYHGLGNYEIDFLQTRSRNELLIMCDKEFESLIINYRVSKKKKLRSKELESV